MEKLYVNEIHPNGDVSTVGLFYSQAEAESIVAQLRSLPDRVGYGYEIIEAVRHVLSVDHSRRTQSVAGE
jgi:hypothetical protein